MHDYWCIRRFACVLCIVPALVCGCTSIDDSDAPIDGSSTSTDGTATTVDSSDSIYAYNPKVMPEKMIFADSWLYTEAPELHVEEWVTEKPKTKGKYILIQFWHTFSPPSLRMLPHLNEWHEKYKDKLAIICISDEGIEVVRKSTEEHIKFFSAVDTQNRTHSELKVWGLPHVIIIEPECGFVIWEGFPLLPGYELTETAIKSILAAGNKLEDR